MPLVKDTDGGTTHGGSGYFFANVGTRLPAAAWFSTSGVLCFY